MKPKSLKSQLVTLRYRIENAARDVLDRTRGRCARAPMYMVDGGYHHWRCGLARGHDGPCRSGNYFWGPGGSVFAPEQPFVSTGDRKSVRTRRQAESQRRWHEMATLKRRHAAQAKATDGGDW